MGALCSCRLSTHDLPLKTRGFPGTDAGGYHHSPRTRKRPIQTSNTTKNACVWCYHRVKNRVLLAKYVTYHLSQKSTGRIGHLHGDGNPSWVYEYPTEPLSLRIPKLNSGVFDVYPFICQYFLGLDPCKQPAIDWWIATAILPPCHPEDSWDLDHPQVPRDVEKFRLATNAVAYQPQKYSGEPNQT